MRWQRRVRERLAVLWPPSRWGLRVRSALVAAAVITVVLGFGATLMLWLLLRSMFDTVDSAAVARLDDIAAQLRTTPPETASAALFEPNGYVVIVEIVGRSGRVLRSSERSGSHPPLIPAAETVVGQSLCCDSDLRLSARRVDSPSGPVTVMVAGNTQPVEDAMGEVALALAIGTPVVVAVAAGATYALVGRSLLSVETIRSRVAGIGSTGLAERVPVPSARDEVARLAVTMNEMLGRIQAGHLAQRRFLSDASHELRSPLATVLSGLELARDHPGAFDTELAARTLLPEAERMRYLIDDLLMLAAADENGLTVPVTDVDLDDVAAIALEATRHPADVTLARQFNPVRVRGDARSLTRVARNLLGNAITHTTSIVTIRTVRTLSGAQLIVDDDGPGIPVSERERVFERFVRLQDDRGRDSGGAGLGLAIVAEIVAAHGGTVTIEDSPYGGARVLVKLPLPQA
ncbi:sensor histidine kinase [Nocardia macrotermitis]|uniref:histidine kinase n=1 Tax=Nocardia macrotermitis TaxID=2585198 RepID=A0A7K0D092_9NOCA|nr:HAMP domain-containing sensor histidine kinase [Nocardia macrotermitis]MQY19147.1 Adaptive-response sensory-kinase SasA [Nocardia macrotermitis]